MKYIILLLSLFICSQIAFGLDKVSISPTGAYNIKANTTAKIQTYNTGAWQDRLTILNDGKVGVGMTPTTYNLEVAGKLLTTVSGSQIKGTLYAVGPVATEDDGLLYLSAANGGKTYLTFNESGAGNRWAIGTESGNGVLYFRPGTTSTGSVANINNSTGVYTATSDRRLKTDIKGISYGLNEVIKLNPVSFKMKSDNDKATNLGFIAQDVEKILPETVNDMDKANGYKGISYIEIIPVLTKAIQEQQAIIEKLEKRIAELESK